MNKLIVYTASFCNPCQRLKEVIEQHQEELNSLAHIELKDIEVHFEDALKHNVRAAPTLILLDEEDKLLDIGVGVSDIIQLRKFITC